MLNLPFPLAIKSQLNNALFVATSSQGQDYYWLDHPQFDALISKQGAQLLSFQSKQVGEVLWLSPLLNSSPGVALRGGVPVCWPVFGASKLAGIPKHGFARLNDWNIREHQLSAESCSLTFSLDQSTISDCQLELRMFFRHEGYTLTLITHNQGKQPLRFTGALHSYFKCDVKKLQISGLADNYVDALDQATVQAKDFTLSPNTDRVYPDKQGLINVKTGVGHRLDIEHNGADATVVWNPGASAEETADIGLANAGDFICIEAANCREEVVLAPKQSHSLQQRVTIKAN